MNKDDITEDDWQDYVIYLERERPWWLFMRQESEWIKLNRQYTNGLEKEQT